MNAYTINDSYRQDRFLISSSCHLPLRLTPNVYLLGSYHFNIYLIKGKVCALVEGGFSIQLPTLLQQIRHLHISFEDIQYLIILHAHPDHLMTFPILKELYPWMQIVGHTESQAIVQNETIMSKFRETDCKVARAMVKTGLSKGSSIQGTNLTIPLDLTIEEGAAIDLGNGVNLEVMHTPGHSPDSISLYLEKHRIIFTSDALGLFYAPDYVKPGFFHHLASYEDSLRRIGAMNAGILCKGHQGAIMGTGTVRDYITLAFEGIKRFESYVEKALEAGWSEDTIVALFTNVNQTGIITSLFPFDSNLRLTRLMLKRLFEQHNHGLNRHQRAETKELHGLLGDCFS